MYLNMTTYSSEHIYMVEGNYNGENIVSLLKNNAYVWQFFSMLGKYWTLLKFILYDFILILLYLEKTNLLLLFFFKKKYKLKGN